MMAVEVQHRHQEKVSLKVANLSISLPCCSTLL